MYFAGNLRHYIQLTKPTIVLSFAITGAAALVMEGTLLAIPPNFFVVLLAIVLTAASANGLNQFLERDLDAKMDRTRMRRPLPLAQLRPSQALWFSIALGIVAIALLVFFANWLSALYALGTILFYALFYTLWLKPRTPYNIVIGGAAGATAPLIAWAAGSGTTALTAWLLFLIIFLWTPPHFWALALCIKEQYAKVGIPMLPVVKGEDRTRKEIFWYTLILTPATLSLYFLGTVGVAYLSGAVLLNAIFVTKALQLLIAKNRKAAHSLFTYSIFYLLGLFVTLVIDFKVKDWFAI